MSSKFNTTAIAEHDTMNDSTEIKDLHQSSVVNSLINKTTYKSNRNEMAKYGESIQHIHLDGGSSVNTTT